MNYNKRGFTLVELLIAISIMATLMAILIPNFMGARERARDAQKIQDMESMKNALRLYYNDHQAYPTGTQMTLDSGFSGYMNNNSNLGYTYEYWQENNGDAFVLCANLEAGVGNDDTNSQEKCGFKGYNQTFCNLSAGATGDKVYAVCAK